MRASRHQFLPACMPTVSTFQNCQGGPRSVNDHPNLHSKYTFRVLQGAPDFFCWVSHDAKSGRCDWGLNIQLRLHIHHSAVLTRFHQSHAFIQNQGRTVIQDIDSSLV